MNAPAVLYFDVGIIFIAHIAEVFLRAEGSTCFRMEKCTRPCSITPRCDVRVHGGRGTVTVTPVRCIRKFILSHFTDLNCQLKPQQKRRLQIRAHLYAYTLERATIREAAPCWENGHKFQTLLLFDIPQSSDQPTFSWGWDRFSAAKAIEVQINYRTPQCISITITSWLALQMATNGSNSN